MELSKEITKVCIYGPRMFYVMAAIQLYSFRRVDMQGKSSEQQQQVIRNVLASLLPPEASARFRQWFPFSKVMQN